MNGMEIEWKIGRDDVARIKDLLRKQSTNALVRTRRARNLADEKPPVNRQQRLMPQIPVGSTFRR